jgi:hypothetical protein
MKLEYRNALVAPNAGPAPMKWSHKHTLNTGLILIGFLAILSSGASLYASKILADGMAALTLGDARNLEDSQALRLIGFREVSDAGAALLTGDPVYARLARSGSAALRERLVPALERIPDPQGRTLADRIETTERGYREVRAGPARPQRPADGLRHRGCRFPGAGARTGVDALVAHTAPAAPGTTTQASLVRTQTIINTITSITSIAIALAVTLRTAHPSHQPHLSGASSARVIAEGQTRDHRRLREERTSQLKDEFLATVSHSCATLWHDPRLTQLLRAAPRENSTAAGSHRAQRRLLVAAHR